MVDDIRRRWAAVNPLDIELTPAMEAIVKDVYELFEYIDALEEESACWQEKAAGQAESFPADEFGGDDIPFLTCDADDGARLLRNRWDR